jgi:hypothetical protein
LSGHCGQPTKLKVRRGLGSLLRGFPGFLVMIGRMSVRLGAQHPISGGVPAPCDALALHPVLAQEGTLTLDCYIGPFWSPLAIHFGVTVFRSEWGDRCVRTAGPIFTDGNCRAAQKHSETVLAPSPAVASTRMNSKE